MTRRTRITLSSILIGLAAVLFDQTAARAGWCYNCGSNSATLGDDVRFDELNINNLFRPGGPPIRITASRVRTTASPTPIPVTLRVTNDVLSAFAGGTTYSGLQLKENELTIDLTVGASAYQIRVFEFKPPCAPVACPPLTFWVDAQKEVPHYVFRVRKLGPQDSTGGGAGSAGGGTGSGTGGVPGGMGSGGFPGGAGRGLPGTGGAGPTGGGIPGRGIPGGGIPGGGTPATVTITRDSEWRGDERYLCPAPYTGDAVYWGPAAWDAYKHSALFFKGDQYNAKKKTVESSEPGWFNVACAGTAIYKMHLLRHTAAGRYGNKRTSPAQRTAMLKAIMADYCGDGKAWTGDGTPLYWTDSRGWFPSDPGLNVTALAADNVIEAIWGPKGAICLNTPRRLPKVPNPVWGSGCSAPAVQRSEVVANCAWLPNMYQQSPPPTAEETKKAKKEGRRIPALLASPRIPRCDEDWIKWWNNRNKNGTSPYVLTANVKGKDANYCDPD